MKEATLSRTIFYILLLFIAAFCLGPFLWQLLTSLKPTEELITLPPILPSHVSFQSYENVFEGRPFERIILNSAVVAVSTTVLSLLIGSLAGYSLAALKIRGKQLTLGLILSISMFPPIATVSPLFIIIRALGLRDTYIALIVPYAAFALPLTIWIVTNFFKEIPADLQEASKIDGCTPFQTFFKVYLPLAAPGLVTAGILVFIFSWNEFLYALTFTTTERSQTIPVGIALFPGLFEIPWGDIAAATIIVTIPIVLVVFSFQRRIVSGLTAGSVKG
ncbi:MAG TPA: carbohydrate ABC transporter permease [Bacteroidota bacterium]